MPGENFNAKAQIDVELSRAITQANSLAETIVKIGTAAQGTVPGLSRLERQAAGIARSLGSLNGATNAVSAAQRKSTLNVQAAGTAQIRYASAAQRTNVAYSQQIPLIGKTNDNLISQRYALYDVARTWAVVSTAILGTAAVAAKTAIDYERAFANVQRTTGVTGEAIGRLKDQLIDLSTTIPTSFNDIAGIASLGGQLGIASGGIDEFTSVVARLTATTDLSSDAAGTALGRFQALLDVPSNEFENLGSAILKVGVNSVATETQIVGIATQISSMGQFAGLTADQVIGLSGALASVGGQPELSRGTITRVFTLMSKAVSDGGTALQGFANTSNVTAAQFKSAWGTDAFAGVFQSFLSGLESEGNNAVATLNELGITSVRDVPLLLRLAGASDVVQQAFSDAATGYAEGTELGSQFAIIAETISAKLTMLGNTLKGIIAEVSEAGGFLTYLLDAVQGLASAFLVIARTPVGKAFLAFAGAAGIFVGVMALMRGTAALAGASLDAMRTAQVSLTGSAAKTSAVIKELTVTMGRMALGSRAVAGAASAATAGLSGQAAATGAVAATTSVATGAVRAFGAALKTTLISTGIGAAILGISWAVGELINTFNSTGTTAEDLFGDLSGLTDAINKDTQSFNGAKQAAEASGVAFDESAHSYQTITQKVDSASESNINWESSLDRAFRGQSQLSSATDTTTGSIEEQTYAIGKNSKEWLVSQLAKNEDMQAFYQKNQAELESLGFNFGAYIDATLASAGGGEAYLKPFYDQIEATRVATVAATGTIKEFGVSASGSAIDINNLNSGMSALDKSTAEADARATAFAANLQAADSTNVIRDFQDIAVAIDGVFGAATSDQAWQDMLSSVTGVDLSDATEEIDGFDTSLSDLLDTEYALTGNTAAVQSSIASLGESLFANGNTFSEYSAAGQANLTALQSTLSAMVTAAGGDNTRLATMVAGLMQQMTASGYDAVNSLSYVQSYLAQLTGGKGTGGLLGVNLAATSAGIGLDQGFSKGAQKAAKSAGSAAKKIYTLTDYVSDLSGVFSKAFDFRFGLDQSIDDVANSYQSLIDYSDDAAQAVRDAAQSIAEADAKIRGLTAANGTLEYQLSVAQEYGDILRANEILAEMADNNADLSKEESNRSDAQKNLTKAQDQANKSLLGGTEGSREQREEVLSLLAAYQDQITALANTGLTQDQLARKTAELKQQFVDQLRQLGYSEAQVQRYAQSFDDLSYAIGKVPRDLTIAANTDAGIRAVDEFISKLNAAQATANNLSNTVIGTSIDDTQVKKLARGMSLYATMMRLQSTIATTPLLDGSMRSSLEAQIKRISDMLNSGNYSSGGFTGRGGKYSAAGVVHRGEYVIPKESVNQSTGLPYANALNSIGATTYQSNSNNYYGGGFVDSTGGIQLVELLPTQLQQIIDGLAIQFNLDGNAIAASVNRANTGFSRRGNS